MPKALAASSTAVSNWRLSSRAISDGSAAKRSSSLDESVGVKAGTEMFTAYGCGREP